MFWLVENKTQFEEFKNRNVEEAFVEIIPYSPFIHPAENSICSIYIRPLQDHKGYMFPIYHTEVEEKLFEAYLFQI